MKELRNYFVRLLQRLMLLRNYLSECKAFVFENYTYLKTLPLYFYIFSLLIIVGAFWRAFIFITNFGSFTAFLFSICLVLFSIFLIYSAGVRAGKIKKLNTGLTDEQRESNKKHYSFFVMEYEKLDSSLSQKPDSQAMFYTKIGYYSFAFGIVLYVIGCFFPKISSLLLYKIACFVCCAVIVFYLSYIFQFILAVCLSSIYCGPEIEKVNPYPLFVRRFGLFSFLSTANNAIGKIFSVLNMGDFWNNVNYYVFGSVKSAHKYMAAKDYHGYRKVGVGIASAVGVEEGFMTAIGKTTLFTRWTQLIDDGAYCSSLTDTEMLNKMKTRTDDISTFCYPGTRLIDMNAVENTLLNDKPEIGSLRKGPYPSTRK